jgi:hypothetical protein
LLLGQSDGAVVAIMGLTAFSTGFIFRTMILLKDPMGVKRRIMPGFDSGDPAPLLKFGVQFSDGSRVSTLDPRPRFNRDPKGPVLVGAGGEPFSSSGIRFYVESWVWPLPSPGPLAFYSEWPDMGISQRREEIDSGPLLALAGKA